MRFPGILGDFQEYLHHIIEPVSSSGLSPLMVDFSVVKVLKCILLNLGPQMSPILRDLQLFLNLKVILHLKSVVLKSNTPRCSGWTHSCQLKERQIFG